MTLFIAGAKPEFVTTRRADLIEVLDERIAYFEELDIDVRIAEARIELRFAAGRRTRSVAIKPPNIAVYTRDGDADVIEAFALPGTVLARRSVGAGSANVTSALEANAWR